MLEHSEGAAGASHPCSTWEMGWGCSARIPGSETCPQNHLSPRRGQAGSRGGLHRRPGQGRARGPDNPLITEPQCRSLGGDGSLSLGWGWGEVRACLPWAQQTDFLQMSRLGTLGSTRGTVSPETNLRNASGEISLLSRAWYIFSPTGISSQDSFGPSPGPQCPGLTVPADPLPGRNCGQPRLSDMGAGAPKDSTRKPEQGPPRPGPRPEPIPLAAWARLCKEEALLTPEPQVYRDWEPTEGYGCGRSGREFPPSL